MFGSPFILYILNRNAYFATCGSMILIMLSDRKEGLWNRTLLAGVKVKYIVFSQLTLAIVISIIQNLEFILSTFIFGLIDMDKMLIFFIVLVAFSTSGAFLGIMVALIFENFMFANSAVMFLSMVMMNLAGVIWPYEAFENNMKTFATFFTFALPIKSVNNILFKDMSMLQPEVYKGFLVLSFWSIASLILATVLLNKKVFSRNT